MDFRSLFFIALFPLFAEVQDSTRDLEAGNSQKTQSSARTSCQTQQPFLQNRRIPVLAGVPYPKNGPTHLFAFAEFLYWTSGYDLNYATIGQDLETATRSLLTFGLNYQPGFRVGLGYQIAQQGWDLLADWIYFHNYKQKTIYSGTNTIYLAWASSENDFNPTNTPSEGGYQTSDWGLYYNQGEIQIGNPLHFSPFYVFRPNAGVRYIYLTDGFHLYYGNTESDAYNDIKMNNKVYGFGFSFGLDNRFLFGKGFFLDTECKTALVYASSNLNYPGIPSEAQEGFLGSVIKKRSHELIPMIEGKMDLGWRCSFCHEEYAFSLTAGYEYRVLINGFTALSSSNIVEATVYPYQKTNLYLHGMNVGATFSF